jgi:Ca2+/Na+ antiporter
MYFLKEDQSLSYFESIASSCFKKSSEGKNVFYPWGVLGKGYIIPSEEETIALRKSFKRGSVVSFLFVYFTLYMVKAFGLPVATGFILLYAFVYYIYIQTITRHWEKTSESLSLIESYSNMSRSLSWLNLILLTSGCFMFVVAGIWVMAQDEGFWVGLSSVVFFGFGLGVFTFQMFKKLNK